MDSAHSPHPLMQNDPGPTPLGRGLTRRIARQEREAALMADPGESVGLDRLHQLRLLGAISAPEASQRLTELIARQHARREQRAA